MSTFKVTVTQVLEVLPHENADRLEICKVYGWHVVAQKGLYKAGDRVVYVPVDSVLTDPLESVLFPADSKVKLHNHRVRSIRLRGALSQGMLVSMSHLPTGKYVDEQDVSTILGITKYEPEEKDVPACMRVGKKKKKVDNPHFRKYTEIENFKYYDRVIQDGEQVYVSEKLHGTSARFGWFPNEPNTLWKKIKFLFGMLPEWEYCWGSRKVQIQNKIFGHNGFKSEEQGVDFDDVYTKISEDNNLRNVVPEGYAVYGEIVGDGIQKNYSYGCGKSEHKFYVYDILETDSGKWVDYPKFKRLCALWDLERVPELYVGPFSKEVAEAHKDGDSTIGGQKVREGVVVKPTVERCSPTLGRVALKLISDAYYLNKDQTDFH